MKKFDNTKDKEQTIIWRVLFLPNDGYATVKTVKRQDLKNFEFKKNVKKKEMEQMIKISFGKGSLYEIVLADLGVPCVVVQDPKTREHFLVRKDCYWW